MLQEAACCLLLVMSRGEETNGFGLALGDRFGLFIQTLNNAEKLFIQIIHSIEKRIIAHLVMGDRFGLFIQTSNNA